MINTVSKNAPITVARAGQVIIVSALMLFITACGEVDSNDGRQVNSIDLPLDTAFKLQCIDVGIAGERCILDDPENPYARTPINDENKFDLAADSPSAKSNFYLWGTAQARSPRGEHQFNTAVALHEIFTQGGSELARVQAQRAYRSVLDNYFNSVTFFKVTLPEGDTFFPQSLRELVGENLIDPANSNLAPLYNSELQTLEAFGEWGYFYNQDTGAITPNN